ncbi:GRN protein, partial [Alopecoenas beccarii]|nr:GRN protein [Alopecoenas beccarii]
LVPCPQAVCCADGRHCCPQGTACDLERSTCTSAPPPLSPRGEDRPPQPAVPALGWGDMPALTPGAPAGAAVPCDATRSCRGGQRCCRGRGGSWGCCPFAQGSCCSDGRHCCPGGSRCTGGGWGCSPQRWDQP